MPQKPVSDIEQSLIDEIRQTGHHKNYELIEYVNDVNRQYAQVLMEVNIDGEMDTAYTYGNERIALERFTGWTGYYTHDPRGSVSGVTDSGGRLWKSYHYGPTGDITFGKPQYNNSYAYNAEDYNPNLEVQYLRARYYDVERGNFLTEDMYLGKLTDPLTLNRYNYVKSSAPNYVDPSGHKKQSWTETADQAKKNWQEYNKMPVQDYDSGPDYGSKNKELLEELDKKLSTARTKLQKLMDAAEEKGRSVIGYCSDYKAGMDAGRKIAEAEYHNWELTLLFGKNAYKRDDYFGDTDLQEIYDQARNASNNKDAFSAGFTAGQTMFTIEILSLIVGALESGGSSSGDQQVVLPGVGEVTIPGDAAGSVAGVLPPGSILRDQENKKESEEEGKGDSNSQNSSSGWSSKDPLVGDVANAIDDTIPGKVSDVNRVIRDSDGRIITDLDIELDNAVIQVKSGGGKGLTTQLINTANATGKEAIGYVPDAKPSIIKGAEANGFKVFTNLNELINYLKGN
ncbi:hypothetical protein PM006_21775 [[Clostridium] symbiosum]|uniref:RHS repeat-associated core domain-containing protein n=1 Tax=Clostridium symbiosum TaxID=1512 RepID=A0AB35IF64_CLOSY|nr:RHS repeat-associated core domain-containing protein [[Clostridium] symbiosum]MDB2002839.1 hypothetical protein [[Clostridium] symbiosum]